LVGQKTGAEDLAAVDEFTQKQMQRLRTMPITELLQTDEKFSDLYNGTFVGHLSDGREVELVAGGARIPVTEATRTQFASLVEQTRLHEASPQMEAVKAGLAALVPAPLLSLFTWEELEVLVCGARKFDMGLLKRCTTYDAAVKGSPEVGYLWRTLEEMTEKERSMFLRYVRGITKMPLREEDFKHKMHIVRHHPSSGTPDDNMPHAHTCFFRLELPQYSSFEVCRKKLTYAIANCPVRHNFKLCRMMVPPPPPLWPTV